MICLSILVILKSIKLKKNIGEYTTKFYSMGSTFSDLWIWFCASENTSIFSRRFKGNVWNNYCFYCGCNINKKANGEWI